MRWGLLLLIFLFSRGFCQTTQLVTSLMQPLHEVSGLIAIDGQIIGHNDRGGEAALYEIDTLTGIYSRKVIIANANNVDWEDLALDNNYIYIGDFGNNDGDRTDLRIYRVPKSSYLSASNDTVSSEIIHFSYADQVDFSYNEFNTNFDAEALIVHNDTLYVLTKNWINQKTYIYSIPNLPGNYSAQKIDSLNPQGLVTGATYDTVSKSLRLIGYQISPFMFSVSEVVPPNFSSGINMTKTNLSVQASIQIEGVTNTNGHYYFSAEQNLLGAASLYRLNSDPLLEVQEAVMTESMVYPNPCHDIIFIMSETEQVVTYIYNSQGTLLMKTTDLVIDVSSFSKGVYVLSCHSIDSHDILYHEKIIKI